MYGNRETYKPMIPIELIETNPHTLYTGQHLAWMKKPPTENIKTRQPSNVSVRAGIIDINCCQRCHVWRLRCPQAKEMEMGAAQFTKRYVKKLRFFVYGNENVKRLMNARKHCRKCRLVKCQRLTSAALLKFQMRIQKWAELRNVSKQGQDNEAYITWIGLEHMST